MPAFNTDTAKAARAHSGKNKGKPLPPRQKARVTPDRYAQQRQRFILAYVSNHNATQAAIAAGYSPKSAAQQGSFLIRQPEVQEAIVRLSYDVIKDMAFDGADLIKELATLAFAPITPGYVSAAAKTRAIELLGQHFKLWEGSSGSRDIVVNILAMDEKTL